MKTAFTILVSAISVMFFGCGKPDVEFRPDAVVSWKSLLADAAELRPSRLGRSRLFSSAVGEGPVILAGESVEIYGDLDHGSFLDVKDVSGGVEATLAEMSGAGAITWMWSANPVGELVLQIDGKEIVYPFKAFLEGKWLPTRYPFAAKTAGGYNLHFPIVHEKHCRIAIRTESRSDLGGLFYQVAWNAIHPDHGIEAFSWNGVQPEKASLKQLSDMFTHPPELVCEEVFIGSVAPGANVDVLSISGAGIIQCLELRARSKEQLGSVQFEAVWDGLESPAISCPLNMLCGTSRQFEDVQSHLTTVSGAKATLRCPLPFSNGAILRIKNSGEAAVQLRLSVSVDRMHSSPRRFHGKFSNHWNLQADEQNVLNLATVDGKGAFVGYILQVDNHSGAWWGEGDPLIWLDSEDHTAWRGTGTEDYFGFAWCSTKRFNHPFRGQTCASPVAATMYRYHILDPLPFDRWAKFDFEAHGTGSGSMDYSALVLWYSETSPEMDGSGG